MVTDLFVYEQKGSSGHAVSRIECQRDSGIVGDIHANGGERQIAIQAKELTDWVSQDGEQGLCTQKFKANIVIAKLDFDNLKNGSILSIAGVKLRITSGLKKCYPNECEIFNEQKICRMLSECVFASVLSTGTIDVGDTAERIISKQ